MFPVTIILHGSYDICLYDARREPFEIYYNMIKPKFLAIRNQLPHANSSWVSPGAYGLTRGQLCLVVTFGLNYAMCSTPNRRR